jgi:hypothetical protein
MVIGEAGDLPAEPTRGAFDMIGWNAIRALDPDRHRRGHG